MNNYYNILGVSSAASLSDIRTAYRKKAKLYHPDISKLPNAHQLFIEATEAYEFLIKLKSAPIPQDEKTYQNYSEQWEKREKPRAKHKADHFSKMHYRDFKKTQYYKATQTAMEVYLYLSLGVGVIITVASIYGFMDDIYSPRSNSQRYANDVIIFILGLIFIFFSIYQLFDLKKENKKNTGTPTS